MVVFCEVIDTECPLLLEVGNSRVTRSLGRRHFQAQHFTIHFIDHFTLNFMSRSKNIRVVVHFDKN